MSAISKRIVRELEDIEFRNEYKRARVRTKIAYQIKALRKQRDWLQGKLAQLMGKPQSTVSRFEDVDYGKLSLETLFEISDAFDLGLIVEFVGYPEFMIRTSDLSEDRLTAQSYSTASMAFLSAPDNHKVQMINTSGDRTMVVAPIQQPPVTMISYMAAASSVYSLSTQPLISVAT